MRVTDAMVSAGAALSTTGRENDPGYRDKVRRILEAGIKKGEHDYVLALLEASNNRKVGDTIEATTCAVEGCTCGYWHSCWCHKCGHVQSVIAATPSPLPATREEQ